MSRHTIGLELEGMGVDVTYDYTPPETDVGLLAQIEVQQVTVRQFKGDKHNKTLISFNIIELFSDRWLDYIEQKCLEDGEGRA